jgi:anaphase-promoting complex subunit 2
MFSRFDYYLCKCFFEIRWVCAGSCCAVVDLVRRTEELFDIIVDFPDSMAALEDLKVDVSKLLKLR